MNDELHGDLLEVDALLRSVARAFPYPSTPALSGTVLPRLSSEEARTGWLDRVRWQYAVRSALAALAALAVVLGALLAVPQSREALADFFGLGHVRVTVGPVSGPPPPTLSPNSFARPATAAEAQAAVDFDLRYPAPEGERLEPAAVYVYGEDAPVVIFVYDEFDLYQTRLGSFGKEIDYSEPAQEVEVEGLPAIWLETGGHIASFLDEQGRLVVETRRSVDRATLLWERDGLTFRLETSLSQEEAIGVAELLR